MFDVGFNELLLIAVIGLLVLGPERLPKVAAQIGRWVARARRTATQLRQELEREIALSEIAKAEKRGQEKRRASAADEEDAENDEAADDYERDLYTTTHEGLGAGPGAEANGYDNEHAAAEQDDGARAQQPQPEGEDEPQERADETRTAPEHGEHAGAADEEPQKEPTNKPPPA
jgi:sec-independent protein translocase protein TatB